MSRATTKEQLIQSGNANFKKLFELIDSLSNKEQEQIFLFEGRDRNIRDVLIHLYEWHKLLWNWVNSNQKDIKSNFLPEPYNWKTYPEMNIEFWKKHQKTTLNEAKKLVKQSHLQVLELISTFSDKELFTKKYYPWTGTTSLGSYSVSATASHYDWAIKIIKKHKKNLVV